MQKGRDFLIPFDVDKKLLYGRCLYVPLFYNSILHIVKHIPNTQKNIEILQKIFQNTVVQIEFLCYNIMYKFIMA